MVKAQETLADPAAVKRSYRDALAKQLKEIDQGMQGLQRGLTVHVPPTRLVITGAVHISQALAPIANLLGYDVTIVDPRTAFATRTARSTSGSIPSMKYSSGTPRRRSVVAMYQSCQPWYPQASAERTKAAAGPVTASR